MTRTGMLYQKQRNISGTDEIICQLSYCLHKLDSVRALPKYRRTYQNYVKVIIHKLRRKYPVQAVLRNGSVTMLHNNLELYIRAQFGFSLYDYTNDMLTIWSLPYLNDNNMKVKLCGVKVESDTFSILVKNSYHYLPAKGKTVIDVGANIGDSTIYFALCGAHKVIALEPFPKNYELAEKNIELNGFSNKIIMLLAGCAAHTGYVTVDPDYEGSVTSRLTGFSNGVKVPLLTLEDILNQNNVSYGAVLKMDCEGCEYDNLLSTPENVLRKFSHMLIEYHYGYKNIKEKLEKSGFHVTVTRPRISRKVKLMRFGYIFAKLN